MSETYWDLLKHPEWQRKRLEVMERAGFACEECGAGDKTLNVHHGYYEKGKKPWEYPTETLHCLCEPCHKSAQAAMDALKRKIGILASFHLQEVAGYISAMAILDTADELFESFLVSDYEFAAGVAAYCGVEPEEIIDCLNNAEITAQQVFDFHMEGAARRRIHRTAALARLVTQAKERNPS